MADAAAATGRTASEAPAARPRGTWLVTPLLTSTPPALDTLTVDRTAVAVNYNRNIFLKHCNMYVHKYCIYNKHIIKKKLLS